MAFQHSKKDFYVVHAMHKNESYWEKSTEFPKNSKASIGTLIWNGNIEVLNAPINFFSMLNN